VEKLAPIGGLVVSQRKEWGEILTGLEAKNRYAVSDLSGDPVYLAAEQPGSILLRWFLKALRPFTILVSDQDGQPVLRIKRPFRFYFHRVDILDTQGRCLGCVERCFSVLRRNYSVTGSSGEELFEILGPLLHPWTFQIKRDGSECGKITKRWSGLLTEGFTDADNFGVTFPVEWNAATKAVALGAIFLIDFVQFDR